MKNATDPLDNKTIAIVGSRKFQNIDLVKKFVYKLPLSVMVISGGAAGVDSAAIEFARRRKMRHDVFWPDKTLPSPERYYKRNRQIVRAADLVVIFWDGQSGGSKYVKEFCEKIRREHMVITPETEDTITYEN